MVWVVQMISPVFRCHHMSGSSKRPRTVNTASTIRAAVSIAGNEHTLRNARIGAALPLLAGAKSVGVKLHPTPDSPIPAADLAPQSGSDGAGRPGKSVGYALPRSCSHCFPEPHSSLTSPYIRKPVLRTSLGGGIR